MTTFRIVDARLRHCGQMVRRLRLDHTMALLALGVDPHRDLRSRFSQSSIRRAWLIDGEVAAIGGVTGALAASEGFIWLAVSPLAARHRTEMVREARRQIAFLMATRRSLSTLLIGNDDAARRFAVFLGFRPVGQEYAAAESRWGRRWIIEAIEKDPDLRHSYGQSFVTPMVYDRAEAA